MVSMTMILQFCLVLLVIALTVAAIMFVMILLDIRLITKKVKQELKAITLLVDILDLVVSGFHLAKKKLGHSNCCGNDKEEN
jgi:hypothetical protein